MSHQYGPEPFPGPYLIQLFGLLDFRSEPVQNLDRSRSNPVQIRFGLRHAGSS